MVFESKGIMLLYNGHRYMAYNKTLSSTSLKMIKTK